MANKNEHKVNSDENIIKVLTVKDISGIMKLGRDATYSLMKSSSFPSYRINNRYYVTEDNFKKWINSLTHKQFLIDNK